MKGVVFHLLESTVTRMHGEDFWDEVLEQAGVEGAYTTIGTYPDEELLALTRVVADRLGVTSNEVTRRFAVDAAATFAERFADFFRPHKTTRGLLLALNDIIHPEVRKLYPEARTPHFNFEPAPDGRLLMHYHSHRQMCAFAEGLIIGSAPHFGERATVEQPQCVYRGDDHCVLLVGFTPAEEARDG